MTIEKTYSIGLDIGGTKMLAILFDGKRIISDYTLATPQDNLDHFMIMLNAVVEPLFEKAKIDKAQIIGIGLGVAGVHDYTEKKILNSPNITILNNVRLGNLIEAKFHLPVFMDNDANCFLRAEATIGAVQKFTNVYGIIIGTGIGGAWWLNNEVYNGAHGGAGEPGEMIINTGNGMSLEGAYHFYFQNNVKSSAEDAYRGDPLAQKAFAEWANTFGIALANIVNIIDPQIFVIGGGSVGASDLFLSQAKKIMRERIESSESRKIKIVRGKLGTQAGAIGAALLVK
jgi:glucokinase